MTSAVSDGGPSEVKALHALASDVFFPNLNHVTRDRAHRGRSVQKGAWHFFNDLTEGLLGMLLSDERSLCRMLQTSHKYSRLLQDIQARSLTTERFSKVVQNFSFAAQRFDSLALPLLKIVHTLPVVYKFLIQLTSEGDATDQQWACSLIERLTGPQAYRSMIRAAMAADALLVGHAFIRVEDLSESNPMLKGTEACRTVANCGHLQFCVRLDFTLCLMLPSRLKQPIIDTACARQIKSMN